MEFNPNEYLNKYGGDEEKLENRASSFQERLFNLFLMRPNDVSYNMNAAYILEGSLDLELAERGVYQLVNQHEILNTVFYSLDGTVLCKPLNERQRLFKFHEVSESHVEKDYTEEALRLAENMCTTPFNLLTGPLHNVDIVRIGPLKHLFLLRMSHVIGDATSLSLYFKYWLENYRLAFGTPEKLAFSEFIRQEKDRPNFEKIKIERKYWKQILAELPPIMRLGKPKNPNIEVLDSKRAAKSIEFSNEIERQLVQFSRDQAVTPFTTMLAGFQVLLSVLSGELDTVTGIPISKRNDDDRFLFTIGPLVNTVVIRGIATTGSTFVDFLSQINIRLKEAAAHSNVTIEMLLEDIEVQRNKYQTPLFQCLFNYVPLKQDILDPKLTIKNLGSLGPIPAGHCNLHFCVTGAEGNRILKISYDTNIFEEDDIVQMGWLYLDLLKQMITEPQKRISQFSVGYELKKTDATIDWNARNQNFTDGLSIPELIEKQMKKNPQATAIEFLDRKTSYEELVSDSNRLARHLAKIGVGKESHVAVCLERSEKIVVAILAVLKAGGICVPLDPSFPRLRLIDILSDCKPKVLITQTEKVPLFSSLVEQVVSLDQNDIADDWDPLVTSSSYSDTDLAYLIYTSGSTGKPKGALIQHRSIINVLDSVRESIGFDDSDVLVSVTPYSFDISIADFFLPLIFGGKLLLADIEQQKNGYLLMPLIERATFMSATPGTWQNLIDSGWKGNPKLKAISTGEALSKNLAHSLLSRSFSLWNLYGPTEATIWSAIKEVKSSEAFITIGKPIANTYIYIVDQNGNPAGIGEVGELYIGGLGVACGYLNRPQLTAEKFVPDFISTVPRGMLYRTGDLGKISENGDIQFLGRDDHQIKVRGFRVELSEIEELILTFPEVIGVVVIPNRREEFELDHLIAFVLTDSGEGQRLELLTFLRERLPDYLIPSEIIFLQKWPLTLNGKIDRKELLHLYKGSIVAPVQNISGSAESSQNQTIVHFLEKQIREIVGLSSEQSIDPRAGFFSLGLTSLTAIELRNRISSALSLSGNRKLPNTLVFKYPNIESLSEFLIEQISPAAISVPEKKQGSVSVGINEPIAIVGMSCRFPGGADNPEKFWKLLASGTDALTEIPKDRFDVEEYYDSDPSRPGKTYVRRGGFLNEIDKFDSEFFAITPREALSMDPQQRIILETCWEALEDAGEVASELYGSKTGVCIGAMTSDYPNLLTGKTSEMGKVDPFYTTGNASNAISGRVSYFFGFHGPAITLDTGCSSSLVAIDTACQYLRNNSCDRVIAGGINTILSPIWNLLLAKTGALSQKGTCSAFDESADGYVRSEGCGVLVLKRLSDAEKNGDQILAVIRGSAVNQDGRSISFTAPNGQSQQDVITQALKQAGIHANEVSYIEAHGTGTPLGDPIELQAINDVFKNGRLKPLIVGSVKTNIGHTEAAAGMAGVIKTILSLRNQLIPKHLHFKKMNTNMAGFEKVMIPVEAIPWKRDLNAKRFAGISSFGISGTNAHLILEEPPEPNFQPPRKIQKRILTLSAKTKAALDELVKKYHEFLISDNELALSDVCAATQLRRNHFEWRIAVVTTDIKELKCKLSNYILSGKTSQGFFQGKSYSNANSKVSSGGLQIAQNPEEIAELYVSGAQFNWKELSEGNFNSVKLPTYPFQRKSFWISRKRPRIPEEDVPILLGKYTNSSLHRSEHIFENKLGVQVQELLAGHKVNGTTVVPAAVFCEMILMGAKKVLNQDVVLKNISFESPVLLSSNDARLIQLAISADVKQNSFKILSKMLNKNGEQWINHVSGDIDIGSASNLKLMAEDYIENVKNQCTRSITPDSFYQRLSQLKFNYEGKFRSLIEIRFNDFEVLACVKLAESFSSEENGRETYQFHPALLDCCLHAGFALFAEGEAKLFLPVGIERMICHRPAKGTLWTHLRLRKESATPQLRIWDVSIFDSLGLMTEITGFTTREVPQNIFAIDQPVGEYVIEWRESSLDKTIQPPKERWLILADRGGVAVKLAEIANASGIDTEFFRADMNSNFSAINVTLKKFDRLIHFWSLDSETENFDEQSIQSSQRLGYESALVLAKMNADYSLPLVFVTRAAQVVGEKQNKIHFLQSSIWGLGRVLNHEKIEYQNLLIDLDSEIQHEEAQMLFKEITSNTQESEIAFRGHKRMVPRIVVAAPTVITGNLEFKMGSYLITGGLSGIGFKTAELLIEKGAKYLVLIGRSQPTPQVIQKILDWESRGTTVKVVQADVSDPTAMQNIFSNRTIPPLKGIIHSAGVIADGLLQSQDWETYQKVIDSKVKGIYQLSNLVEHQKANLDFFISYSSVTSLFGSMGQANYAAANAIVDTFSHHLRMRGIPAITVNWGPWADLGIAQSESAQKFLNWRKTQFISLKQGHAFLDRIVMGTERTQILALNVNWNDYIQGLPSGFRASKFSELKFLKSTELLSKDVLPIQRLVLLGDKKRRKLQLLDFLVYEVANILGLNREDIPVAASLMTLGMDSLLAVELRNSLKKTLPSEIAKELPATLIFTYPTIEGLSDFLLALTDIDKKPNSEVIQIRNSTISETTNEPIAIIGMSCRFPGGAENPEKFWKMLENGEDAIGDIPKTRFNIEDYYNPDPTIAGKTYVRRGGFLTGIDQFDPQFFGISPKEALAIDPQQRLLLEVSWEALEQTGEGFDKIFNTNTGVYVGVMYQDYADQLSHSQFRDQIEMHIPMGAAPSALAGRLSYFFNFKGSAISVDTACSSSLTAIHMACQNLRSGDCDRAIAGGANIILSPVGYISMSRAQAFSEKGTCSTFDNSADGYVRSEGCGVVVLKRLSDAEKNGDPILAVIRGSAVNQDGRSSSFTAPNGKSQEAVIKEALSQASVLPAEVGYIEAHGTGTLLGDPIELQAIFDVFGKRNDSNPLVVGSVKTNIGHTEAAAGIAGVIKTVLSLKNQKIPKHLHFTRLNSNIADNIAVKIPVESINWARNSKAKRIAGVSSFGISGTNAHLILEEGPDYAPKSEIESPNAQILTLSAKSDAALKDMAKEFANYIADSKEISFASICASANTGKAHLESRLAIIASTHEELYEKLICFGNGEKVAGLFQGRIKNIGSYEKSDGIVDAEFDVTLASLSKPKQIDKLAELYVSGVQINWRLFHSGTFSRLKLPSYPFQRQRYWIERGSFNAKDKTHVLLGRKMHSSMQPLEHFYETIFSLEKQPYFSGHKVFGRTIIPGAAYCEMALSAGKEVWGDKAYLKNISIESPIVLEEKVGRVVQLVINETNLGAFFKILSRETSSSNWITHVTGNLEKSANEKIEVFPNDHIVATRLRCRQNLSVDSFYDLLKNRGFDYTGKYQGVKEIYYSDHEVLSLVSLPKDTSEEILDNYDGYFFHPALLDSCLHSGFAISGGKQNQLFMPIGIEKYSCFRMAEGDLWTHIKFRIRTDDLDQQTRMMDVNVFDRLGLVAQIQGLASREVSAKTLDKVVESASHQAKKFGTAEYEINWLESKLENTSTLGRRNWLILADRSGVGSQLVQRLLATRDNVYVLYADTDFKFDLAKKIRSLSIQNSSPLNIVHLWSLDIPLVEDDKNPFESYQYLSFGSGLELVKVLEESNFDFGPLTFVTRGAQSQAGIQSKFNFRQSSLWGLARVINHETAKYQSLLLDLDPETQEAEVDQLYQEICANTEERELIFRKGKRYVSRLQVKKASPVDRIKTDLVENSSYLITGGLGGIGFRISEYLVSQGAKNLVLVGRKNPSNEVLAKIKNMETSGIRVHIIQADIANAIEVKSLFAYLKKNEMIPKLKGIVHSAGINLTAPLLQQSVDIYEKVASAKVMGAWNLHIESQNIDLDFFVMCSSVGSIFGYPGQGSYAAVHSMMDILAHYLRARGCPVSSINWGPWLDVGMLASVDRKKIELILQEGEGCISSDDAVHFFGKTISEKSIQVGVMQIDWLTYVNSLPKNVNRRLFSDVIHNDQLTAKTADSKFVENWKLLKTFAERQDEIIHFLKQEVVDLLGISINDIDLDSSLMSLGMDSLMAVEFRNALKKSLGVEYGRDLPAILIFNYPTIRNLSGFLMTLLNGPEDFSLPISENPVSVEKHESRSIMEPIAITGMSCRFPGGVDSPEKFWKLLEDGVDAIGDIPKARFDIDKYFDSNPNVVGKTYVRRGGFIDGIEKFDPQFFGISAREALALDPQQRLMLEVSWEALEQTGEPLDLQHKSLTDVYVGAGVSEFMERILRTQNRSQIEDHIPMGVAASALTGRLAYFFNFKGSAMPVDTACSSSITAIHLACQSLRNRSCDRALAGGVNIILSPDGYIPMSRLRTLSQKGSCSAFDESADGYVRSEGCGVLVLKRLSDAEKNGDQILAVIRGSAVNQDGRSFSFTAPNGQAQQDVMSEALRNSGVGAEEISYVEAHGTGTALGDPIEMHAIAEAYRSKTSNPLVVGSVKTNIGNTEAASGIAGVIKTILALKYQKIPTHLHFTKWNPNIDLKESSIRIPTETLPWKTEPNTKRIAGVSSFGISGTNAHLIIEEAPPMKAETQKQSAIGTNEIFVLSAKSKSALIEMVGTYIKYLHDNPQVSLKDLCANANQGKSHFGFRLAIIADSKSDLSDKLKRFQHGESADDILYGHAKINVVNTSFEGLVLPELSKDFEPLEGKQRLFRLGQLYVLGNQINWQELGQRSTRLSLPTYPFQREIYWLE